MCLFFKDGVVESLVGGVESSDGLQFPRVAARHGDAASGVGLVLPRKWRRASMTHNLAIAIDREEFVLIGGLFNPAVEVDMWRYDNGGGAVAAGGRIPVIIRFRNTTNADVDVSGSIDLEQPNGQRNTLVGPVQGLTIQAGRSQHYLIWINIGATAAAGNYTAIAGFSDPAGGFDIGTFQFAVQ